MILSYRILPGGQFPGAGDMADLGAGADRAGLCAGLHPCGAFRDRLGGLQRGAWHHQPGDAAALVTLIGAPALTWGDADPHGHRGAVDPGGLAWAFRHLPGRPLPGRTMSEERRRPNANTSQRRSGWMTRASGATFPRSADLTTAAVYAGLILVALFVAGKTAIERAGSAGMTLLGQADRLAPEFMRAGARRRPGCWPISRCRSCRCWLLPVVAALLGMVGQRSLIFSPDKLAPKLSRISSSPVLARNSGVRGCSTSAKARQSCWWSAGCWSAFLVARHASDTIVTAAIVARPGDALDGANSAGIPVACPSQHPGFRRGRLSAGSTCSTAAATACRARKWSTSTRSPTAIPT